MAWLYKMWKVLALVHCFVWHITPSAILWCSISRYQCHRLLSSQKYRHTLMSTLWTCSKSLLYGNTTSSPCLDSLYPVLQEAFPESCKPHVFCLLRALKTGWQPLKTTHFVYICILLTDLFTSLRLYEVSNMSGMGKLKYHRLTNFPKMTAAQRGGFPRAS